MQSPAKDQPSPLMALLKAARNLADLPDQKTAPPTLAERQRDGVEAIEELRHSLRPR